MHYLNSRLAIVLGFLSFFHQNTRAQANFLRKQEVNISLQIYFRSEYCGGARPTDEILQSLEEKLPYAQKYVYLRIGRQNNNIESPYKILKTDKNGKVKVKLPPNTYCLVGEHKNKVIANQNLEQENSYKLCQEWQQTCDAIITILPNTKLKEYTVDFYFTCNPCLPPAE
ncbi:MAG: hypothetical protein RML72_05040 [Bacteroidia bacterium]|nr:hypothetical protein [Bacteroidia bacterium]MDW8158229.1 hypothetical protein [Bacteroidia bacterium]